MPVVNTHSRVLPVPVEQAAPLVATLATPVDRLWPADWPPMRFADGLAVGARGGHGPIRYTCTHLNPGRWVRFAFTAPRGFDGFHEFTLDPAPAGSVLVHRVVMSPRGPARLSWPLLFRWLHDGLLAEAMDTASSALDPTAVPRPRRLRVRVLRAVVRAVSPAR